MSGATNKFLTHIAKPLLSFVCWKAFTAGLHRSGGADPRHVSTAVAAFPLQLHFELDGAAKRAAYVGLAQRGLVGLLHF